MHQAYLAAVGCLLIVSLKQQQQTERTKHGEEPLIACWLWA
jgi:hypothetical protein